MCYIADDMARLFEMHYPKARKAHKCVECFGPIDRGSKYQACSGLWDDGFATYKTCLACATLRDEITTMEYAEGCDSDESTPPFGTLIEAALEREMLSLWPNTD